MHHVQRHALFIVIGSAQVNCFADSGCENSTGTEADFVACCLRAGVTHYEDGSGCSECQGEEEEIHNADLNLNSSMKSSVQESPNI